MEEVLGEYIINIAKENLQVAVLRGKLKLDNVQLDGDLIGSHVLGAVGLSGTLDLVCIYYYYIISFVGAIRFY